MKLPDEDVIFYLGMLRNGDCVSTTGLNRVIGNIWGQSKNNIYDFYSDPECSADPKIVKEEFTD